MKIVDVKVGMRVVHVEGCIGVVERIDTETGCPDKVWCHWSNGDFLWTLAQEIEPCEVRVIKPQQDTSPTTPKNKYSREISPGVFVDVYDVLRAFDVTDPCLQHLVKKALAVGQRGHKDVKEDLNDILASAKRAVEMNDKWRITSE